MRRGNFAGEGLVIFGYKADRTVPQRMEVLCFSRKAEHVSPFIPVRMEIRNVFDAMHGLMNVTEEMNQPTQRIDAFLGVSSSTTEKACEIADLGDHVWLLRKPGVGGAVAFEWNIDKVK